ncbi:hypothetical protein PSEUDO8AS_10568 [Pseudomonas sp. 8AS]|nr:hypothetical protein PSEUDO8AS_10568 [Pseudomonas sp. 8AS]
MVDLPQEEQTRLKSKRSTWLLKRISHFSRNPADTNQPHAAKHFPRLTLRTGTASVHASPVTKQKACQL